MADEHNSEDTLDLGAQPEGGYTVTSPLLPELITERDTVAEALANARDAFAAVAEIHEDRDIPALKKSGRLLAYSVAVRTSVPAAARCRRTLHRETPMQV